MFAENNIKVFVFSKEMYSPVKKGVFQLQCLSVGEEIFKKYVFQSFKCHFEERIVYWCSMFVHWITWTYILIPCKYQGHGTIIGWDMKTKPKTFDEKLKPQGKFLCKLWLCFLPSLTAKQPKNGHENGHEKCHENRHQFLTLKSD